MQMFWKLLEKSVLTSGLIALVLVATACYCVVAGVEMPEFFTLALGTVIGYFFSEKASRTLQARNAK